MTQASTLQGDPPEVNFRIRETGANGSNAGPQAIDHGGHPFAQQVLNLGFGQVTLVQEQEGGRPPEWSSPNPETK